MTDPMTYVLAAQRQLVLDAHARELAWAATLTPTATPDSDVAYAEVSEA